MLLLMQAALGGSLPPDPIGITQRTASRFLDEPSRASSGTFHGGGHRRFARIILPILALLFLHS